MKASCFARLSNFTTALAFVASALSVAAQTPAPTTATVSESGPHHRVWQWSEVDEQGLTNVHAYTELATGMNVWNAETRRWDESDSAFDLADGVAVSRRTQHRLTLAAQINAAGGAVDLLAPDGRRFRSTILGLTLFNRQTGRSLALAELKSDPPAGELIASNAVLYPDCFDNLRADVRVENRRDGFHHDVILRESLDRAALTAAGFPPDVSMLETWTEWFEAPEPRVEARVVKGTSDPAQRALMAEPDIIDESLDFGTIQFGQGIAYLTTDSGSGATVPVFKRWVTREGHRYLVEACELTALQPLFGALPSRARDLDDERLIAGRRAPAPSLSGHRTNSVLLASADTLKRMETERGLVSDYTTISTDQSGYTFKSDTTYLVSAPVNFSGANFLEGGAVIKFAPASFARIALVSGATLTCLTSPYRPAIFTARDDHSIGEKIGTAALSGYYATTALYFAGTASDVKHVRIAYAEQAVVYNFSGNHTFRHSQIVNCQSGLTPSSSTLAARNVLMNNVTTAFATSGVTFTVTAQHVTVNGSTYLANAGASGATLNAVNCLLANVTSLQPNGNTALSGNNNGFYLAPTFGTSQVTPPANPFVTVKAGAHYLVAGSNLRNAGSTSIDSTLANQLKSLTTYPPIERTAHFTAPTTLGMTAPPDTDTPDVGFHYDRLDHLFTALDLTSTLVLTNGAAIGVYGTRGVLLKAGAKFISEGAPTNLNRLVRYHAVQEQANTTWTPSTGPLSLVDLPTQPSPAAEVRLRFTDLSMLADTSRRRQLYNSQDLGTSPGVLSLEHCQWRGLYLDGRFYSANAIVNLTNNLIQRGSLQFGQDAASGYQHFTLNCYNNLFLRGGHSFGYNNPTGTVWTVKDNLFDCEVLNGGTYVIVADYNGYRSGLTSLGGSHNKLNLTPDYQSGPANTFYGVVGGFYYPTTGGQLSQLLNAGSRSPATAGLAHYTVKTAANTKEWTDSPQTVDIGSHYVGVNASNLPLDYDGDTVADYAEDRNGNGSYQTGETFDWQLANTDGVGNGDLQEYELSFNILVNDAVQDYAKEQNTQFESTVAVLNGNVIVGYVDSNQGVYAFGSNALLTDYTPRFVGYAVSRDNGVTFEDRGVPLLSTQGTGTSDDGDAGDPVLAVDKASGILYLVGTSMRHNDGWKGIPLWKSTDGEVTFPNTPINIRNEHTQRH